MSHSASAFSFRPAARTLLSQIVTACTALVLSSVAPAQAQQNDGALAEGILLNLVTLSSTQLAQARLVAAWEWQHHEAADSTPAETVLLEGFVTIAPRFGIDQTVAKTFYTDQIDAGQQVRKALIAGWQKGGKPPLVSGEAYESTRAELYRLSQSMLSALARTQSVRTRDDCPILLAHAITRWTTQMTNLPQEERDALPTALGHVCSSGGIGGTA